MTDEHARQVSSPQAQHVTTDPVTRPLDEAWQSIESTTEHVRLTSELLTIEVRTRGELRKLALTDPVHLAPARVDSPCLTGTEVVVEQLARYSAKRSLDQDAANLAPIDIVGDSVFGILVVNAV